MRSKTNWEVGLGSEDERVHQAERVHHTMMYSQLGDPAESRTILPSRMEMQDLDGKTEGRGEWINEEGHGGTKVEEESDVMEVTT